MSSSVLLRRNEIILGQKGVLTGGNSENKREKGGGGVKMCVGERERGGGWGGGVREGKREERRERERQTDRQRELLHTGKRS